jgi:predicted transcriptional regulator
MSFNSTRYHVDRLTESGEILRVDEGGYSRLYPAGMSETDKLLFALIRRPTDGRLITCLVETGKATQRELCKFTGFAKSTISEHLSKLVRLGVIKGPRIDETKVEYELVDPIRIRELVRVQNPTLIRKATDRFIDLWDF